MVTGWFELNGCPNIDRTHSHCEGPCQESVSAPDTHSFTPFSPSSVCRRAKSDFIVCSMEVASPWDGMMPQIHFGVNPAADLHSISKDCQDIQWRDEGFSLKAIIQSCNCQVALPGTDSYAAYVFNISRI